MTLYARHWYGFLARDALTDPVVLERTFVAEEGVSWADSRSHLSWFGGNSAEETRLPVILGNQGRRYLQRLRYTREFEVATLGGDIRISTFGRLAKLRVESSSEVLAVGLRALLRRRLLRVIVIPTVLTTFAISAVGSAIVAILVH